MGDEVNWKLNSNTESFQFFKVEQFFWSSFEDDSSIHQHIRIIAYLQGFFDILLNYKHCESEHFF